MAKKDRSVVVGVFTDRTQAQRCVEELRRVGFREDQIGVVGREGDTKAAATSDKGTHVAAGAATGVAAGAGVGALWALGIAAGFLPAIGPVIAGGIFASILASAAGAAAAGGLAGALIGMGVPEEEAHYYENEFKSGRTVVTVKTTTRQDEARRILGRFNSYDMESRPDRMVGSASRTRTDSAHVGTAEHTTHAAATNPAACRTDVGTHRVADVGTQKVQLREEQLQAQKDVKQAGEVRVRKDVVTERKTIEVPVTREEVVIERHAAPGTRAAGDITTESEIRIPVKEEEVRVTKTPVVKEEVTVGKRKVTETKTVAADVRREELRVDEAGDVNVKGDAATGRTRRTK